MVKKLGRRAVLRAGYGAVIGVLVLSLVEAYFILSSTSQQHVEIFRHYVDEEETLTTLRRNLWLAGNYVRDFFIQNTPEQAALLAGQLRSMRDEDRKELDHLAQISPQSQEFPKLRRSLEEFWDVVLPVPGMLHTTDAEQYAFLQREIVPRRGELYAALVALSSADQQRLQENEKQFSDARTDAAERLLLMIGLSVLLCILVASISIRHSENLEQQAEQHYAAVEQARTELQQLSARLIEVEEDGRRRLARELHDEIGQSLALLQIEVSHAQTALQGSPADLRERLQRARALAETTVQSIRDLSVLLRPALLDDLGLVPALQFQVEHFVRRSEIACEFVEEDVAEHLPDGLKTCVYRVVQEALHNCEKHSGATRVEVSVRQGAKDLVAEVQDNGRGFVVNEKRTLQKTAGFGLLGMRERAALAGGSLTIDSAPEQGTRIVLRIPVPERAEAELAPAPAAQVTA